ncbi:MAG: peptidase MA family metallohydrolase [bacterium]
MQCPKCGYNNPDEALFCNLCHAVFRKESSKKADVSPEEERYMIMHRHREGRGWKRWIGLDVWLSLIVIIVVACWAINSVTKREEMYRRTKVPVDRLSSAEINSEFSTATTQPAYQLAVKRETSHFIIYTSDAILADDIVAKVEIYYDIPTDLGFGDAGFWLKDKVTIYVFDTPEDYFKATGKATWSSGYSEFKTRSIYSHKDAENLIDAVIPHELTHLIFADFMEFSPNFPKWLAEGLAVYEENKFCKTYINNYQEILDQIRGGKYFTADQLTAIDISQQNKIEIIHLWYTESLSIVTYLIDVHGRGKLYAFCKNLKEGMELNKALENAYSPEIKSLPELTGRWLNYIKSNQQTW